MSNGESVSVRIGVCVDVNGCCEKNAELHGSYVDGVGNW